MKPAKAVPERRVESAIAALAGKKHIPELTRHQVQERKALLKQQARELMSNWRTPAERS